MGHVHPPGMSPLHMRGCKNVVQERPCVKGLEIGESSHREDRELLEDVMEDLESLMTYIDSPHLNDFPR